MQENNLDDLAFPLEWREGADACQKAIKAYNRFIVAGHARLDGDAVSSLFAMGHLLKALHKDFVLYTPYGIPAYLSFLAPPSTPCELLHRLPFKPECVLALDCGTPDRLGEELEQMLPGLSCINIDHHQGKGMGTVCSLVRPEACATAQVLASVIYASGVEITKEIAHTLALGLVADTGGFRHDNVTDKVFSLAARLTQAGADIYQIRECLDKNETLGKFRLWSRLFAKVELKEEGTVALCSCTMEDMRKTGTTSDDTEGFVERMRELKGISIAALVREQESGSCRISLRSSADADVCAIAREVGGGGHIKAAGGTLRMPLKDAMAALLGVIHRHKSQGGFR